MMEDGLYPKRCSDRVSVPLVLATQSGSKQQVLKDLGIAYTTDPADIDERAISASTHRETVIAIAAAKAQTVAQRHEGSLILAGDTMMLYDDQLLGQSADEYEAREMLMMLAGQSHIAITALALYDQTAETMTTRLYETTVQMRALTDGQIDAYIATGEAVGKAGSYAIQSVGAMLIASIDGEVGTVRGMPVWGLIDLFADAGYIFLDE